MSTPSIPASTSAALSALNLQPHSHGHGHKHDGLALDSLTDSGSSSTAQTPSGSTQSLFGTLLNTLEQVVGIQLTAPAQSRTASAAAPASPSAVQAAGSKINVTA